MLTPTKDVAEAPRVVAIDAAQAGQRIDNFLLSRLKGVPRSHIYRILRRGQVRVNKGRIRADYRLQAGDSVRIPPIRTAARDGSWARLGAGVPERLAGSILYEDKWLLVINKPPGMAVHGGSGLSYGVIEALRVLRPRAPFLELAHRLDRETSGCLVLAKRRSVLRMLHATLREGRVEKRYMALLRGCFEGGARRVDAGLSKNVLRSGERVVRVQDDGKPADSTFVPLRHYADATLMEVRLGTGRTHQIRVHAAHIGHPVAGDEKYGDPDFNRHMQRCGLRRLFLHAVGIAFTLPEMGTVRVQAPLDPSLQAVLECVPH